MKKKVLFICYGGGHVEVILPLYKKAVQLGFNAQVLGLTTALSKLNHIDSDLLKLSSFLHLFPSEVMQHGQELAKDFDLNPLIPKLETEAYLGLGYWNLVESKGLKEAKKIYAKNGRKAFEANSVAEELLKAIKPDFCITTSSPRMEEAFVKVCYQQNINCYVILENLNISDYKLKFSKNEYGKVVFCPNQKSYNLLAELGRNPKDLSLVGNPAFEKNQTEEARLGGNVLKEKLSPENRIVLFAMSPSKSEFSNFDTDIINKLKVECIQKKISLVLRPHPNDSKFYYEDKKNNIFTCRQEKIGHLLNACDTLVTQISTVGQEALQLNKEVFYIFDERVNSLYGDYYRGLGKILIGLDQEIINASDNQPLIKSDKTAEKLPSNKIWDIIESYED